MCDFEDHMLVAAVALSKAAPLLMRQELGECPDFDERHHHGSAFSKELHLSETNTDSRKIDEAISAQCLDLVSGLVAWVGYVKCREE